MSREVSGAFNIIYFYKNFGGGVGFEFSEGGLKIFEFRGGGVISVIVYLTSNEQIHFLKRSIGFEGGETPYIGNRLQHGILSTIQNHGIPSVKVI